MTTPPTSPELTGPPRLVLVGPPGAGKTSVGEVLAARWSVDLLDTDQVIEAEQQTTVSDIFVEQGEAAFRQLEEAAVAQALIEHPGVLALGGGAILRESTRRRLDGLTVAFLDVGLAAAAGRIGLGLTRPLLLGNVRGQLKALLDARRPLYAEVATVVVPTDEINVDEVADQSRGFSVADPLTRIRVAAESPYDVLVGRDILGEVAAVLGPGVQRVAVVHPRGLPGPAGNMLSVLTEAGYDVRLIAVPDGEQAKTAEVAASCWAELGRLGWTRSDAVVGVGGGATTDLAGFVAATFLRGIRVVHVPTTLLAMVDAAVGGKTGINTAEGKNLVGSFYEPAGVICDLALLATLPRPELASGLAEVVKCGLIADPAILDLVAADPQAALDPTTPGLRELVERAIGVKARVVSTDLREATSSGRTVGREALNYGHTLAHAIERVERYAFRHGDAVSIGLVYVAELARLTGRLGTEDVERHRDLLRCLGLPTSYPAGRWADLRDGMRAGQEVPGGSAPVRGARGHRTSGDPGGTGRGDPRRGLCRDLAVTHTRAARGSVRVVAWSSGC